MEFIGKKVHKEIFTFSKATGQYEGREWEDIVQPIISKWGDFVQNYIKESSK
jgi:hypothetical protein